MSLPDILSDSRRKLFGYLLANGAAQALCAVATALLVRQAFDRLITNPESLGTNMVMLLPLGIIITILATAWLRWRGNIDGERLGQSYVHAVRMRLFGHITAIGADGARRISQGALMLRFVGDLTALRNWVSLGLARLAVSGLAMILALAALTLVEPVIAIAVAISMTISGTLIVGIGPRLRHRTREVRRHRGRIAALVNDRIAHLEVIEAFGQEQREVKRVRRASKRLRDSLIQRARVVGLLRALSEASAGLASMCALVVGALQVAGGYASAGAVVSAMVVAGLLAPRLNDLSRVYEYWNAASIAREKQQQVLRLEPVGRSSIHVSEGPFTFNPSVDAIRLVSVCKNPLVEPIDLLINPGERIAIIGPNGSGKSSLLRLIGGLVDPDSGKVMLGDREINKQNWLDVRRTFAMVAPDLPLLRASLRLNLTYGAGNIREDEIQQTLNLCGLTPLVERLHKRLETRISQNGAGLSTGERARIAIARALLAKPSILLLDEAEANLDALSRRALDNVIKGFEGTVIYTTHNPELAAKADRVLTIDDGRLISMSPTEASLFKGASRKQIDSSLKLVS